MRPDPVNGLDLKTLVLRSLESAMERSGQFQLSVAFHQVSWRIDVQMNVYPDDLSFAISAQGAFPPVGLQQDVGQFPTPACRFEPRQEVDGLGVEQPKREAVSEADAAGFGYVEHRGTISQTSEVTPDEPDNPAVEQCAERILMHPRGCEERRVRRRWLQVRLWRFKAEVFNAALKSLVQRSLIRLNGPWIELVDKGTPPDSTQSDPGPNIGSFSLDSPESDSDRSKTSGSKILP